MASANEHLVPGRDRQKYQNATVAGLKDQLLQNDLPTNGRKYDLYLRLRDAGIQMYTDRRSNAAALSGASKQRWRPGDGRWDHEEGDFVRRRRGGGQRRSQDRGRPKTIRRDPRRRDQRQGQGNRPRDDDDGDNDDGDDDDGDGSQDGGDGGPPGGGGGPPGGGGGLPGGGPPSGGDSPGSSHDGGGGGPPGGGPPGGGDSPGSSHDSDDDGDQGPPGQWPRLVGGNLPAGLQVQLVTTLHPSALWNLITAAPDAYLRNDRAGSSLILVEAHYQHRLDYPGAALPQVGLGFMLGLGQDAGAVGALHAQIDLQADQAPDECHRPMSLLQWVGRRALTDTQFRIVNRTLIRQVINAYLIAYGDADPPAGVNNSRDDILYYFRNRADLAGQSTVLGRAINRNDMHIVHLLIANGSDVNQVVNGSSVVDEAAVGLSMDRRRLESMFALLAAGANEHDLAQETLDEVATMMQNVTGNPAWGNDADYAWPRIDNLLALPARQFLADERSPIADRTVVAMFLLWEGHDNYPYFL